MSRDFDGVDDVISVGAPTILNNVNTTTWCAWIFPDTLGEGSLGRVFNKADASLIGKALFVRATAQLHFFCTRATTNCDARTTNNAIILGAWNFVAATYSEAAGGAIFVGAPGASVVESTLGTDTVGSGASSDDSGQAMLMGNVAAGTRTFDGRIANAKWFNSILTINQLSTLMRGGHCGVQPIGDWRLFGDASPEPDWSGNNNPGTVTGALAANGPPTSSPFKGRKGWRGAFTAAGGAATWGQLLGMRNNRLVLAGVLFILLKIF